VKVIQIQIELECFYTKRRVSKSFDVRLTEPTQNHLFRRCFQSSATNFDPNGIYTPLRLPTAIFFRLEPFGSLPVPKTFFDGSRLEISKQ